MNNMEFSPRNVLERALNRWWVIVLCMTLGGITGWIFHLFQNPIYEATTIMTISMEFPDRELTQYEQDYAFGAAGNIFPRHR
jgi:uncharacterized protein involved in exopolysaccharide biosynthesis